MYKTVASVILAGVYATQLMAAPAPVDQHIDVLQDNHGLSMADVLNKAMVRAPQQASLAAQKHAVQAKNTVANSYLSASPSISVLHQNDTLGSARHERDWQAQLALPLWLPQEKSNAKNVAEFSISHWEANADNLRLWVAGKLREAVWNVALNRNLVALFQQKQTMAEQLNATVAKQYQAGDVAKTDLMLMQQEVLQAQKRLVDAKAMLMHAHFDYSQLTGLHEIPATFKEALSPLESYQASPLWQFALAKVALAQSERDLSIVQRRNHPQLVLNARTSQGAFDTQYNQSVGVQFQFPLDTAVSRAPRLAAAEQVLGEAISERNRIRYALETALHEAEHNLLVSRQWFVLAEQQALLARTSATLADKAYQLGEIDLMRLLRIKAQAFEAEKSYITQQITVQRDIARYNQAVGVLP